MKTLMWVAAGLVLVGVTGCDRPKDVSGPKATASAPSALRVADEDLLTLRIGPVAAGPLVTGSIQPERRADLRAEVSAAVIAVLKENGDPVRRGDLLVRLDDTAIRDALTSAQESERVAAHSAEQAERQVQRIATLRASGMVSAQALEDAETRRNATQSELAAAKARVVQARQQLQRTEARAPFDGVVSERKVSPGDSAQIGKELLKVIDPSRLRFDGLVNADALSVVKVGQRASFRVSGAPAQSYEGVVKRVSPSASTSTRQVEVQIEIASAASPALAGLYAEGRIEASSSQALLTPASSLAREGERNFLWRVDDKRLSKVAVVLGERDARTGSYVVREGLKDGDRVLRYPSSTLRDGQTVERLTRAPAASGALRAAPAASTGASAQRAASAGGS